IGYKKVGEEFVENSANKLQKALGKSWGFAKPAFTEGVWEEGMQSVVQNTGKNWVEAKYNPEYTKNTYGLVDSFGDAMAKTYGTAEGWKEIQMRNREGQTTVVPVNMCIETVEGFSGHSDRKQILNFVKRVSPSPEQVLTCHGEASKCVNLASTIHKALNMDTKALTVTESIKLR
ncbi:MAG: MBL fold metallo-hydrolase RNA specificity domain-containing protein, partial [Candidatus Sifarchaeia archaeon]